MGHGSFFGSALMVFWLVKMTKPGLAPFGFFIAALRAVDGNAAGKASFAVVSGDLSSPQDIFFPGAWKGRFQNDMGARNVLGMEPKIMGAS